MLVKTLYGRLPISVCGSCFPLIAESYICRIRDLDLGTRKCFLVFAERKIGADAAITALKRGIPMTRTALISSVSRTSTLHV
jgi:hypothetical protein